MPKLPTSDVISPGTYKIKTDLSFNGFPRTGIIHVPEALAPGKGTPLVVVLHGAFSTAGKISDISGFNRLADQNEFIVIYPQGIGIFGLLQHWNAGHCCGKAQRENLDDVGFVDHLIRICLKKLSVDRSRIYLVGHSNGGMLVYQYAIQNPTVPAAIAVVAGTLSSKPRTNQDFPIPELPSSPVPVCIIHGKNDNNIPYAENQTSKRHRDINFLSVGQTTKFWLKANNCAQKFKSQSLYNSSVTKYIWPDCSQKTSVVLYELNNWKHAWPSENVSTIPKKNRHPENFDAASVIWHFLSQFKRAR